MAVESYTHDDAWDCARIPAGLHHRIYFEQYGPKNGKPVIFLHGGPGGGTSKRNAQFFDPAIYRVILMDQRGAGKSLPAAELQHNTSQDLVADIEMVRKFLGIEQWHLVFGGSWGSTLALLYAQTHPESVKSMIVRGIYIMRKEELEFMKGFYGTAQVYPAEYEEFLTCLPVEKRGDPLKSYYELLTGKDEDIRLKASNAWNKWELCISQMEMKVDALEKLKDETWSLQHARIEAHYEINGGFMEEGQLLRKENLDRIRHIPCSIVHGRYDMVCPVKAAYDLAKAAPEFRLYIIPMAGHSAEEPGTKRKLIELCDEYAKLD